MTLVCILTVAEKLKAEGKQEIFRAEEMEEIEDEEGNVYNRKVYNDLKTQGSSSLQPVPNVFANQAVSFSGLL